MASIKPAEVSKILRQQLEGIQTGVELEEVGTVLEVGDGIARIYGLSNAESNELIEFENGIQAIVLNLEEDNIGAVLLGPTEEINEGDIVKRTGRIASINVGEGLLGRVITPTGQPLVFEKTISFMPYQTGWPPSYKYDCLPDPPQFKNPFAWNGTSGQQPNSSTPAREERDPDWTARMDQRLVDEATNNPRISRMTAMRVFIQLRSWRALDALLAEHMHLALHLSGEERDIIVARWPYQVPRQLPRLARVRRPVLPRVDPRRGRA